MICVCLSLNLDFCVRHMYFLLHWTHFHTHISCNFSMMNKCNFLCELNRSVGIWSCIHFCCCHRASHTRAMDTHAELNWVKCIMYVYSTFGCSTLLLQDFLERHSRNKTVSDFRFSKFWELFPSTHTHTHKLISIVMYICVFQCRRLRIPSPIHIYILKMWVYFL